MRLLKPPDLARPFVDAVPGMWPSEGAAVAVLEAAEHAHARGATARARLLAHGDGFEPTLTSRAPRVEGIVAALRLALRDRRPPDLVLASAHGTPLDAVERAALAEAGVGDAQIIAPKGNLGDAFGASSALATAMAPYLGAERVLVSAICPAGSVGALLLDNLRPM
jgi:3-oxoacyl-(acyl-carrier-protein) synthase